jgi:hypothetical protein
MVSADGGGAAVTSIGASLLCATAAAPRPSDTIAANPLNVLTVMRRNAVILPRLAVLDGERSLAPKRPPHILRYCR